MLSDGQVWWNAEKWMTLIRDGRMSSPVQSVRISQHMLRELGQRLENKIIDIYNLL